MITFTQETTRYTVKPENAQKYRALAAKPPKTKNETVKRSYPIFKPGMSTAHYVQIFNAQFEGAQHKIKHDCANYYIDAPMLDATQPEVIEELDPDWTSPAPKAKKPTTAQLLKEAEADRDLYLEALEAIYEGIKDGSMTSSEAMMLAARVIP